MEQIFSSYSDNRLIINEGELSLQRLAAIVVAVEILPYNLRCSRTTAKDLAKLYHVCWWLEQQGWKIAEKLSAPKKIRDLVSKPMELMAYEIDAWMKYHVPQVFTPWIRKRYSFVVKFIRHFVWTQFGTINYVRTAEKLIAGADLKITLKQKYRLARLNCLVGTIANLCRENPAVAKVEERLPLTKYWNSRIAVEEFDMNRMNDEEDDDVGRSTPQYLPVWAYLLDHMNEGERLSFAIGRMMELPARVVKELLPKFTEIEQRRLFREKLPELIKLFVVESYPEFAIQLWRYVKDTINAKIYYEVFQELQYIDQYFGDDSTPLWVGDLEMEMWRCASGNLKESMFQYNNGRFLDEWTYWFNYELCYNDLRDDTFLLEMLSDASPEYRKEFWMTSWESLVVDSRSEHFSKLIKACLPDPGDVDEFMEELANSSQLLEHLKKLCEDLKFLEFTEFLDRFVRDTKLKTDLKKRFVPSEDYISERRKLLSDEDFEALSILLVDVCGNEIPVKYKASFIRSEFIRCMSDRDLWSAWYHSRTESKPMGLAKHQSVVRDAERFCDEQELRIVKQKLLADREYFEALAKEKKNTIVWDDLLKWLIDGRQAMLDDSSLLNRYRSRSPINRT